MEYQEKFGNVGELMGGQCSLITEPWLGMD
jgi:hypothetical protein